MQAMQISRSGLDVEWQRLQTIALNIANVNSSHAPDGTGFRPLRLVSGPSGDFASLLSGEVHGAAGVKVIGVDQAPGGVRRAYEPDHPDADAGGFVTYPDIDHAGEMTMLIKAARVYEANLTALNMAHQMYSRALELGRRA